MLQPKGRPEQENTASQHLHPTHKTDVQHKHLDEGHFPSQMLLWHFMRASGPLPGTRRAVFLLYYCPELKHGGDPTHPCLPPEMLPCCLLSDSFIDYHTSGAQRLTSAYILK